MGYFEVDLIKESPEPKGCTGSCPLDSGMLKVKAGLSFPGLISKSHLHPLLFVYLI